MSLKPPRRRQVGLILDSIGAYDRGVIRGVMEYANAHPEWTVLAKPRWSYERGLPVFRERLDGVIFHPDARLNEQVLQSWGVPVISVAPTFAPGIFPLVTVDSIGISLMAADHFRSRGFTSWAFYGPDDVGYSRLRCQTLADAATQAGARYSVSHTRHTSKLVQWLKRLPKPTGIMAASDIWAHRLLEASHRGNVAVPDAVAILGVDDDPLFNGLASPPLSSIALPLERIGYEAAAMLDELLNGRKPAALQRILQPLSVVTRRSTDVMAIPDTDVAAALRFIRDHAYTPFQIDDVMDAVLCSRRSLERRFRAWLGRSVADEIRRMRVERAQHLLQSTEMKMEQIAHACGFVGPTRMGIVFRQATGMQPRQYRQVSRRQGSEQPLSVLEQRLPDTPQ